MRVSFFPPKCNCKPPPLQFLLIASLLKKIAIQTGVSYFFCLTFFSSHQTHLLFIQLLFNSLQCTGNVSLWLEHTGTPQLATFPLDSIQGYNRTEKSDMISLYTDDHFGPYPVIKIRSPGNWYVFRMVAVSWDHMIAICDFPQVASNKQSQWEETRFI